MVVCTLRYEILAVAEIEMVEVEMTQHGVQHRQMPVTSCLLTPHYCTTTSSAPTSTRAGTVIAFSCAAIFPLTFSKLYVIHTYAYLDLDLRARLRSQSKQRPSSALHKFKTNTDIRHPT